MAKQIRCSEAGWKEGAPVHFNVNISESVVYFMAEDHVFTGAALDEGLIVARRDRIVGLGVLKSGEQNPLGALHCRGSGGDCCRLVELCARQAIIKCIR